MLSPCGKRVPNLKIILFSKVFLFVHQKHAEENEIWDRNHMGTCQVVLETVDQLLIDNCIMEEVFFIQYENLQEWNYLEQHLKTILLHYKDDAMQSRRPRLPYGHNIETGN